jgi:hypothetical protein
MSSNAFAAPAEAKTATPKRIRVSPGIATGLLMKKVQLQYPEDAKQERVQGIVPTYSPHVFSRTAKIVPGASNPIES